LTAQRKARFDNGRYVGPRAALSYRISALARADRGY